MTSASINATLLEARPKPHVLDDATIERTKRVNGESLEWCDVCEYATDGLTDPPAAFDARLDLPPRSRDIVSSAGMAA